MGHPIGGFGWVRRSTTPVHSTRPSSLLPAALSWDFTYRNFAPAVTRRMGRESGAPQDAAATRAQENMGLRGDQNAYVSERFVILGGTACSPCCICEVGILNHERRAKDLRESKQNQLTLHSKWIIARSMNRSSDRDSRGEAAARCKWNRGGSLAKLGRFDLRT